LNQDWGRAVELYARAAARGRVRLILSSVSTYYDRGNLKKAKFHYKAAAMAGHKAARNHLGAMEAQSGNMGRAVKHHKGLVSRDVISSILTVCLPV